MWKSGVGPISIIDTQGSLRQNADHRRSIHARNRGARARSGPPCVKLCSTPKRLALALLTDTGCSEIGAVEIVHQALTGKVFHTLLNPSATCPTRPCVIHGHTAAFLKDKPIFASVVDEFLAFIGDARLIIHNAEFDMGFVNEELRGSGASRSTWTASSTH